MLYGYVRISTVYEEAKDKNQTFERQLKILKDYGVKEENIFKDRITGGSNTEERSGYNELMATIKAGDTIIVTEMSRFSRSMQDLLASVERLMKKQIGIKFIKENLEIGTERLSPLNKLMFQLIGAFNEFEKSLIGERVREGLAAKKAQGVRLGRPANYDESKREEIIFDYKSGASYDELIEKYNISRPTLAKLVKPYSAERKSKLRVVNFN